MPHTLKSRLSNILSALCLLIAYDSYAASATSDALILLEPDGRSHTIQYTIASDGPLIALELPPEVDLQQLSFLGPNHQSLEENFTAASTAIELWNGVALVRFRTTYSHEITQTGTHSVRLTLPSLPQEFAVEQGNITRSSYTWIFPENLELVSYSAVSEDVGRWQHRGQELAFEQFDRFAVTLSIEYRTKESHLKPAQDTATDANDVFCLPNSHDPDVCAQDRDSDGVPDYRDVCLPKKNDNLLQTKAAREISKYSQSLHDEAQGVEHTPDWHLDFGCANAKNFVLNEVQFPSGYSYLDYESRQALDRLAKALLRTADYFEIAAHTDDAGNTDTNLALAKKRAEAVRYYLLLRGVNPNQVRFKGYGEQYPVASNATQEGRMANRRIELTRLK